jgi:hypothetical protein
MLTDEGAVYKCSIHDFETTSPDVWFKHKLSLPHHDTGVSVCIYCKKKVKFDNIQQQNMDYIVPAKCYYCAPKNSTTYNAKLVITKKRRNRFEEDCDF